MKNIKLFSNQKRTFKFLSKKLENKPPVFCDEKLKKIIQEIDSKDFSVENFGLKLLKFNDEYKYYLNESYGENFLYAYQKFLESRIKDKDNMMDLFPLMLSKNVNVFSKIYKKNNNSELLDDGIIKLSIKINNPDFVMKINDQKDNFLGSTGIFKIEKSAEYYEKFNNLPVEDEFQKYENLNSTASEIFLRNVLRNVDNEKSKMILSKYNIKLNNNYNELVLESLVKNKNEELLKMYINTPSFSLKRCSSEQFKYLFNRFINSMFFAYILVIVYLLTAIFFIMFGISSRDTFLGGASVFLGLLIFLSFVIIVYS